MTKDLLNFKLDSEQIRPATIEDFSWLWNLYVDLLKAPITSQWGWDENFQKTNFEKNLPIENFKIIKAQDQPIAAYCVDEYEDRLHLRLLLVVRSKQKSGVGKAIMEELMDSALQSNQYVTLSVIKTNPVLEFYTKLGFEVVKDDGECFILEARKHQLKKDQ